jgi:hypothetical protein
VTFFDNLLLFLTQASDLYTYLNLLSIRVEESAYCKPVGIRRTANRNCLQKNFLSYLLSFIYLLLPGFEGIKNLPRLTVGCSDSTF